MITAQLLVGQFCEPFLEAALESVSWVDSVACVNTHPDTPGGRENREKVFATVPSSKLRYAEYKQGPDGFSFAEARNQALAMIDHTNSHPFVLWLDADDIHAPEFAGIVHELLAQGADSITAEFMHFVVYQDAVQAVFPREVIYKLGAGTQWIGKVHETLLTTRTNPVVAPYRWFHASYIRGQRAVFDRWKFYADLVGDFRHYDGQNPDTIISDRVSVARRLEMEWPEVAAEALKDVPFCPHELAGERPWDPPTVGFVMILHHDDPPVRGEALNTFHETVGDHAELWFCYNGDEQSLCESLNEGFSHFRERSFDYIGWIHPDMLFDDPEWLNGLLTELRCWPKVGKVCSANTRDPLPATMIDGHEQCYLIRRLALDEIGLFDEGYLGIGGYEDWDMNRRLINAGWRVVTTPRSLVYHVGMGTRSKRDTDADARANADYYFTKWGTREPPV
jgi:hypothetical protein